MKATLLCLLLISCGSVPSEELPPSIPPAKEPLPPVETWPKPVPLPPESGTQKNEYLAFHNERRECHNAPLLAWDSQLAYEAKRHADRCVFAHDATANAGENLAIGYPDDRLAMKAWYDEVRLYNGNWSPATGHYTQMVWVATTKLGCATAQCPQGRFLVCRYLKAGNVLGQFQSNVLPAKSGC